MSTHGIVNYHLNTGVRQAYSIDADGVSGRLASPEHVPTQVALHDVRRHSNSVHFATDGIAFVRSESSSTFDDDGWEREYEDELRALLIRELGVQTVHVFDHTLRVDDPNALRRPARNVHTDYSADGARARLEMLLGAEQAAQWDAGHYAFVNVWRPVSDVVRTAPLGFVRPCTVRVRDWVTLDLVYPDRVGQIMGLVHNPEHEWLYQSAMTPAEVAVFNIHDNRGLPPVAHSAIDLVHSRESTAVRRSIESRTVVRYPTPTLPHSSS